MPAIGTGRIKAKPADTLELRLSRTLGPVLTLVYDLVRVGTPAVSIDRVQWNDDDFVRSTPIVEVLDKTGAAGRYKINLIPVLMPPNTDLRIEVWKNGTVVYGRNVLAGPVDFHSISITRT